MHFDFVKVRAWELRLGRVGETLATWLAVQRRWMYLEAIFSSSDDLRQQLPQARRCCGYLWSSRGSTHTASELVIVAELQNCISSDTVKC